MRRVLLPAILAALLFAPGASAWTWPAAGPVLQPFQFDPSHPYAAGQHRGVDLGGAEGSTVLAPAAGTVSFAGTVPSSGKSVTIETPDGYSVTLTHLGSISVDRNAAVTEGGPVGTIGPSGDGEVAQPYVHLGVRLTAQAQGYLDPLTLLPPRGAAPPVDPAPAPSPAPVSPPAAAPAPAPPSARAGRRPCADGDRDARSRAGGFARACARDAARGGDRSVACDGGGGFGRGTDRAVPAHGARLRVDAAPAAAGHCSAGHCTAWRAAHGDRAACRSRVDAPRCAGASLEHDRCPRARRGFRESCLAVGRAAASSTSGSVPARSERP